MAIDKLWQYDIDMPGKMVSYLLVRRDAVDLSKFEGLYLPSY